MTEITLFDWRLGTYYKQDLLAGTYRMSTTILGEVEKDATVNVALIERGESSMVSNIASVLRIQACHYQRRMRNIASRQRRAVQNVVQQVEEVLKGAAGEGAADIVDNVNNQIDVLIAQGIDHVHDITRGVTGPVFYDFSDGNISTNTAEAVPDLIIAGIHESTVIKKSWDECPKLSKLLARGTNLYSAEYKNDLRQMCTEVETQNGSKEKFSELAGRMFKTIRQAFGIDAKAFVDSIRSGLNVIGSGAGRSGAYFFITHDKKLLLKSVSKVEWQSTSNKHDI